MTLDDFERPKLCHSYRNKKNYGVQQKNLNEDRSILLVAECRPMVLVSRNIKYMWIFAGGSIGEEREVQ